MTVTKDHYFSLFESMNRHGIRYLVIGGVAMLYYGRMRLTVDVDVVVDSSLNQADAWERVLEECQLYPRDTTVTIADAYDPEKRQIYRVEKNMLAFTLISARGGTPVVDLMFDPPFNFRHAYGRRKEFTDEGMIVPLVSREDLIEMKRVAGRPKDLADISFLERTRE